MGYPLCHPEFIEGSQASVPVSNAIVRANGCSPQPKQQHRSHTTIVILSPSISQLLLLTCEVSGIIVHNPQLTSQCHPEFIEGSGVWGIPNVILSLSKDLVWGVSPLSSRAATRDPASNPSVAIPTCLDHSGVIELA